MPFNGVGVFTRLYSWATDAANGVKIRADRMDNEMNGFAAGLSNCVTRDGQGKFTGDIDANGFSLKNLEPGSASSPSLYANTSGNSGLYFPSTTQMGWTIGGVNRMTLDNTGALVITGGLTGTTGTFTGAVAGTTGTFSGAVSAASLTSLNSIVGKTVVITNIGTTPTGTFVTSDDATSPPTISIVGRTLADSLGYLQFKNAATYGGTDQGFITGLRANGGTLTVSGVGQTEIAVNGTVRHFWNANGIATTGGAQPGFAATGGNNLSGVNNLTFNVTQHNDGFYYNAGTGTFIAPVTGNYLVCAGFLAGSSSSTAFAQIELRRNGSTVLTVFATQQVPSGPCSAFASINQIVKLSAGQAIVLWASTGGTTTLTPFNFSAQLLL